MFLLLSQTNDTWKRVSPCAEINYSWMDWWAGCTLLFPHYRFYRITLYWCKDWAVGTVHQCIFWVCPDCNYICSKVLFKAEQLTLQDNLLLGRANLTANYYWKSDFDLIQKLALTVTGAWSGAGTNGTARNTTWERMESDMWKRWKGSLLLSEWKPFMTNENARPKIMLWLKMSHQTVVYFYTTSV